MKYFFRNGLFFFFLTFSKVVFPQDVHFSQLFADRLYLNPAYAGTDYCPKIMLSYRNQWPGIDFPFVTYNTSFDKYIESINGGIGVRVMKDEQGNGVFNQFSGDFIYTYHAKINNKISLRFALEASVYQKSMNTSNLVFSNMIDPIQGLMYPSTEILMNENFLSPDFSSGLLVNFSKYFFGFSASHIPQNIVENHNEMLPLKLIAHVGAIFLLDKSDKKSSRIAFEPNIVYIRQLNSNLIYYGTYFDIREMSLGLFIRQVNGFNFDAIVASYHIRLNKMVIGYSYDLNLSKLMIHGWGAHELSFSYILPCDKKIRNYNTISCPSF